MNRKQFIKTCGYSCLALTGLPALLQACAPVKYIQPTVENNILKISKSEFLKENGHSKRQHVIVKPEQAGYPIVLYRFSDTDYTALLLKCTHQQMELNVNGNLLSCNAHGSEFNTNGDVLQGPAWQALTRYRISQSNENIYIHLT